MKSISTTGEIHPNEMHTNFYDCCEKIVNGQLPNDQTERGCVLMLEGTQAL